MKWSRYLKGYQQYLMLEKNLAQSTVKLYLYEAQRLVDVLQIGDAEIEPDEINENHIKEYFKTYVELGIDPSTQGRILLNLRAFFEYLLYEDIIKQNPTELIEQPKLGLKLPTVLTTCEIERLLLGNDMSTSEGYRNRAMLEVLYCCGLRSSELIHLKLTDIMRESDYIRIIGKGNKERLVPITQSAIEYIDNYVKDVRSKLKIKKGHENIIFLTRLGAKLSDQTLIDVVNNLCKHVELEKKISPHTFRHSFATHLVQGGANLIAVQEMLGHASVTTTEIYTHFDTDYLRRVMRDHHPRN